MVTPQPNAPKDDPLARRRCSSPAALWTPLTAPELVLINTVRHFYEWRLANRLGSSRAKFSVLSPVRL